jgi:transcriptional regulator with XRE-family HTH domain
MLTIWGKCANILAMISVRIKTPNEWGKVIAENVRSLRKKRKLSMARLSEMSGVSHGSIRRFETSGEISLKSLLKIAIVLDCTDDFEQLFKQSEPESIQEIINGR